MFAPEMVGTAGFEPDILYLFTSSPCNDHSLNSFIFLNFLVFSLFLQLTKIDRNILFVLTLH